MNSQRIEWYCRTFLRKLHELEVLQNLRHLAKQGRRRAVLLLVGLLFVLYWLYPSSSPTSSFLNDGCLNERLRHYNLRSESSAVGIDSFAVRFAGNGFIGVGDDNELLFREPGSRVMSLFSGYRPLVDVVLRESRASRLMEITDFEKGQWRRVRCYDVAGECACVEEKIYAHSTRPSLLLQEVKIVNPTNNALRIKIVRPEVKDFNPSGPSDVSPASAQTRMISTDTAQTVLAIICSNTPGDINVAQKSEESLAFMCAAGQRTLPKDGDEKNLRQLAVSDAVTVFQTARTMSTSLLEKEHENAWQLLRSVTFYLSPSKAPEVLRGVQINATRYVLLSHIIANGILVDELADEKLSSEKFLSQLGKCYAGHSTLLYPSRLWQLWSNVADIARIADLWFLTLEKRGCGDLLKAGARGASKAFVLSLLAASFDQAHLEIGVDPADLHRQMSIRNLPMQGASRALVDINLHLDDENIPYILASSSDQLFACPAGCQDDPVTIGSRPITIPVKITKPLTSILYVATSRRHLLQLRSTIHVSEVNHAPPHENEVIALHEHGHRLGGLPTTFWCLLGVLLVAFHVFLIKLLWTEWRKGDTTPYNPYLRFRYQYARSH